MKRDTIHPYKRLQADLAELIAKTSPGERLPSEPQLAKKMRVSRATLREAMRTFEAQGLLRRRQGIGTFVVGHTRFIETGLEVLESIETMAQRIQLDVTMDDLSITQLQDEKQTDHKAETTAEASFVRVARVIRAEKRPVAYLIDILPINLLTTDELQNGFTGSVLDLLIKRGSPRLANSKTEIHAIAASSEVAKSLEIQRGDVLLQLEAYLYTITGEVIDHSFSYFLPGYFHFHVVRSIGAINADDAVSERDVKVAG